MSLQHCKIAMQLMQCPCCFKTIISIGAVKNNEETEKLAESVTLQDVGS